MKELYELKEKLCKELKQYGDKEMSAGSLDVIDKLSHTIKNLDKIIEVYEEEEGYSGRYNSNTYDGNYAMAFDRRSYARGGGNRGGGNSNARGRRYSRRNSYNDGYSYHDETVMELKEIMDDVPTEVKQDIQRVIQKIESM